MNTKLFLQLLLLLGCLSLFTAVFEALSGTIWVLAPRGWWEGAIACWLLAVAVRVIYPAPAK
jgi:hypothetical protein